MNEGLMVARMDIRDSVGGKEKRERGVCGVEKEAEFEEREIEGGDKRGLEGVGVVLKERCGR